MIQALIAGGCLGAGMWVVLRGMFPAPATLSSQLADFAEARTDGLTGSTALRSRWGRIATSLLRTVRGDEMATVEADIAVTGGDVEAHAVNKLNSGLGGAVLLPMVGFMFGLAHGGFTLTLLAVGAFIVMYLVPDMELKRKATERRDEFSEALTAFVTLVAVSITGGGGVNSAMAEATKIGDGWCFDALRRSIQESALHGEAPWSGFDRLGRRFDIVPLIELAGALSLAGTSGARVTETLAARAESGRQRELTDALAVAEKKSESMSIPVAALMLGWAGFIGFPAIAGLLAG
jgi:tight adherence protein C